MTRQVRSRDAGSSSAGPGPRRADGAAARPNPGAPRHAASVRTARRGAGARVAVWTLHIAFPLLGLWLLIAPPHLDVAWEHRPGPFGLVSGTAALAVVLG